MDQDAFARFAKERLGWTAYDPGKGGEEDAIFAASLQSAVAHMAWTRGGVGADGTPFAVVPGFVDRMVPNAVADRLEGQHYIGFYQALLVTIVEFALFAFTQREIFPNIGEAKSEDSPAPLGDRAPGLMLLQKTLAGETVVAETDKWRVPKDAMRHAAAMYLALLMARFVWLHELAHCFYGHVGLVQGKGMALRLYEVPEGLPLVKIAERSEAQNLILRILEFEADEAAFFGVCQIQLGEMENIDGIKALDLATRLGMTVFGAYAMTWLFAEYQAFMNSRDGITHPAPYERLKNICRTAVVQFEPKVTGFDRLHDNIAMQFNGLSRAIPAIHRMDALRREAIDTGIAADHRDMVRDALGAFRYTEANRQT